MSTGVRVLLASNRGPGQLSASTGKSLGSNPGGAVGLLEAAAWGLDMPVDWISIPFPGRVAQKCVRLENGRGHRYTLRSLGVDSRTHESYYNNIANRLLWVAFHGLWSEVGTSALEGAEESWRSGYERVNVMVSDQIRATATTDSMILVQDYHLALVPAMLRPHVPDQPIATFLHTAFSASGVARLPAGLRRRILAGMLGADLLGFHTTAWSTDFLRCCEDAGYPVDWNARCVDHDHRSWVREYPAPIDVEQVRRRAASDGVARWFAWFRSVPDSRLIVRVDRLDPSKNVLRSIEAFELVLDRRPDLRAAVRFFLSLYPSRGELPEYRRYAEQVRELVRRVAARFPGSLTLFLEDDMDRGIAALQAYDVLVVNSLADGMNFVAKEGALVNRRDGSIVLSAAAGSADEFGGNAVTIDDPRDVCATAVALERALDMPSDERRASAARRRGVVESRLPERWLGEQVSELSALAARRGRPC